MAEEKSKRRRHLLNYNVLQEWGFQWASKAPEGYVTSYLAPWMTFGDQFVGSVIIMMVPDMNTTYKWNISDSGYGKKGTLRQDLFRGQIKDKNTLETVLKSVLIFKPKSNGKNKKNN